MRGFPIPPGLCTVHKETVAGVPPAAAPSPRPVTAPGAGNTTPAAACGGKGDRLPATIVRQLQAFARIAVRSGLVGELYAKKRSLAPLVSALCGIRAERMEEAYLVLAARETGFTAKGLLREIQEKHSLSRTWGARGLLQIVATPELPEVLAAAALSPRWKRFLETRSPLTPEARLRLLRRICPQEISRDALREAFPDSSLRLFLLREAAQAGEILWKDGDGPAATFVWTREALGHVVRPAHQVNELVGRYLAAYGPLGAADLGAWLGVTVAAARQLMAKHRVVEIQVEGEDGSSFMRPEDLEELTATRQGLARTTVTVPPGDPLVVAYKTRWRVEGGAEAPGVVFLEGRAVARWTLERDRAVVEPLEPGAKDVAVPAVRALLERAEWETTTVETTS